MVGHRTEIVVELHERFRRLGMEKARDALTEHRDIDALATALGELGEYTLEHVDLEVEVEVISSAFSPPDMPVGSCLRGWEGWNEFWRTWLEPWGEDWRFEIRNLEEFGDHVVLDLWIAARGRESDVPLEMTLSQIWSIRGEKIVGLRIFDTREAAREWIENRADASATGGTEG